MYIRRHLQSGFTLGELMIVIAIMGVLAAIALPIYTNQTVKARRTEGTEALLTVAEAQERHFAERQKYTTDMTSAPPIGLGFTSNPLPSPEKGYYNVTVAAATADCPIATCFKLTATPAAGGPQVSDGVLTLDSRGIKTRDGHDGWD